MEGIGRELISRIILLTPRIVVGLLIGVLFWVASVLLHALCLRIGQKRELHHDVLILLGQVVKGGLITVGIITALGTMGINVSALVASLGLTGFALGFAFRDALSNLLAGVLILI
ncbi:MAG: mechanosensitive ion channel, partial [Nitrospinota bacterium]